MKAAPLLRAWLHRLRGLGVHFHMRHRWQGWDGQGRWCFASPQGDVALSSRTVVLALGASWSHLGSDGAWSVPLQRRIQVRPLRRPIVVLMCRAQRRLRKRQLVAPLRAGVCRAVQVGGAEFCGSPGPPVCAQGEFVATGTGVEGSLIYAVSALLRDDIEATGRATFMLDLLPDWTAERVAAAVAHPRGSRSLSSHLKSRLGLEGIKLAAVRAADQGADA
jgi:predicted flavoprotein YhiN